METSRTLVLVLMAFACGPLTLATASSTDTPVRQARAARTTSTTIADAAPFAPTSFWRTPLRSNTPVDPQSSLLVGRLAARVDRYGPWINTTQYTSPIYEVGADQPLVRVTLDAGDQQLQQAFAAVPLPLTARGSNGTDSSATVWQHSTDTLWEFWRLHRAIDGWHAAWGGRIANVSASSGIYPAPYGATASGLSMLGGIMRAAEVRRRSIDHALSIVVPNVTARIFRWPATRTDGRVAQGIPMGTRFRLPLEVDVTKLGLPPAGVVIARAAQRYGLVVTDRGGAVSFAAEDPASIGPNPWPALFDNLPPYMVLRNFPWRRLQVVAVPGLQARAHR